MRINGMEFTVGADPELFIKKDGEVVSAHGLIEGDKKNPQPVENGAVQVDGMALEFNIDPSHSFKEFNTNLTSVLDQMMAMVPEYEVFEGCSNHFDENYMGTQPKEALILGCEPDYNAYTGAENVPPNANQGLRTAGGHIHIGGFFSENPLEEVHFETCRQLTKLMDQEVGIYSILWDRDDERRRLYGKAGAFRPKTYGMEYRTLSNSWLFTEERRRFVYRGVNRALKKMFSQKPKLADGVDFTINGSWRDSYVYRQNSSTVALKREALAL